MDVIDRGQPARGDDGNAHGIGERQSRFDIEALQDAIAINVGEDDGGDTGINEAFGQCDGGEARGFGPAFDRDVAVPGINADNDAARKQFAGFAHQSRIAQCHGAKDHPPDAFGEPGLDLRQ